ncbi:MAG: pilus assembly protein N-terminal domain-containing protein, partial [Sporomusaceae bacterium]|nr:pilus assembly protein N-terminal domain-containing protein [Sporomusaceae bacterium]
INFYGVQKVAIANPDIADVVVVSSAEVLLVGKSPGTTTLHVWSAGQRESFQVEVVANDIPIANEIKSIIGIDDLKVSKIGKTIILEGKVNSQYQRARAEKVAEAYGDKVVNLLEMTKPVQVKIEAVVLEINKEKTNDIGIKWGNNPVSSTGGFAFGQSFTNPLGGGLPFGKLGGYSPINAQLSAMIKNGSAKILSQPNIITLSGDKANIMIGGQIPIPISSQNGQITIEWKDYGIKLDIAPEVNAEGLINSRIKAEVSSLDWNSTHRIQLTSTMFIPPIKMSKAETAIALSSGQTMAIGGLLSSQTNKDVTKVPFLSNLPIIGKLFTSNSYTRGETELVILITPTIVDPAEYMPQITPDMEEFLTEDPLGGTKDGRKNKSSNR